MIQSLKKSGRLDETLLLGFISLFCFALTLFRIGYTGSPRFIFLNWNLFLAFVPWMFSSLMIIYPGLQKSRLALIGLLMSWLLFFPNAPYILTDLIHLRLNSNLTLWFDLLLILMFSWAGLMFGFMSLWDVEHILSKQLKPRTVRILSVIILFVASFGVYLGRFLRWNSWNIVNSPRAILADLLDRFIDPFAHPRTWGVTIVLGLLLNIIYWSFWLIKNRSLKPAVV